MRCTAYGQWETSYPILQNTVKYINTWVLGWHTYTVQPIIFCLGCWLKGQCHEIPSSRIMEGQRFQPLDPLLGIHSALRSSFVIAPWSLDPLHNTLWGPLTISRTHWCISGALPPVPMLTCSYLFTPCMYSLGRRIRTLFGFSGLNIYHLPIFFARPRD